MLPRAYQRWIGDWLGDIPEEKQATCASCAMQASPDAPPKRAARVAHFGATKCCTFFPNLPNYQVGGILRDPEVAEGARRVAERIRGRVGVDPLCVRPSRRHSALYSIGATAGFGRAETLRCPYYSEGFGGCSIWPYRESVCSTYFCKLNRPFQGGEFWAALKQLVFHLEATVSVHCAIEHGISGKVIDDLIRCDTRLETAADVDAVADDRHHEELWGEWFGREDAYYLACAKLADQLDLAAIRSLDAITLERRLDAVARARDKLLSKELPGRLRAASTLQISVPAAGTVQIQAGPTQPIEMPAVVVEVLSHFQGQPLVEARATLSEKGFDVDTGFLERLWECGFLRAAE